MKRIFFWSILMALSNSFACARDAVDYKIDADTLQLRHPSGKGLGLRAER